jgi:hypothetical protein
MASITLRSHVGTDGILRLDLPVGLADAELEVTVTFKALLPLETGEIPQGKGWSPGFFDETFGSFKDDPLTIDSEGVFDDEEEMV